MNREELIKNHVADYYRRTAKMMSPHAERQSKYLNVKNNPPLVAEVKALNTLLFSLGYSQNEINTAKMNYCWGLK